MVQAADELPGLTPFTAYGLALTILPMRASITLIVLAALLAACGYKGPLYLPPEKPVAQKPAPQPASENENKKPSSR